MRGGSLDPVPSVLIYYQYFYPDDVVSSVLLTELAEGLASRGWQVTARPSNRSCHRDDLAFEPAEDRAGVRIRRVWRPGVSGSSNKGRLMNSLWMLAAWSADALFRKPDVVVAGTDPVFSVATAIPWSLFRRRTVFVHWCFDLYPDAAVADGILRPGLLLRLLTRVVRAAYRRTDLLIDIGSCMRDRLLAYGPHRHPATIYPWALEESAAPLEIDPEERAALFGGRSLGILYSGSFGRAHSYGEMIAMARLLRGSDVHFAVSIRGNCADEFYGAVMPEDVNISFVPFAPPDRLAKRLSAADIQIVSLRPEWTGTVVPSKFFGALAAGRPVLFFGSEGSAVARLIREYALGWVCAPGSESCVARQLAELARAPEAVRKLASHCHAVYRQRFSREVMLDQFDRALREQLKLK